MKAVFLAAGRGSRLGATELPKPLWEIGPRSRDDPARVTILERQIEVLQSLGVERVAVVVGWRQDQMRARLRDSGAVFIENTHGDISESGSAHSFHYAAQSSFAPLDGSEPCLLLDADLVYERRILEPVLEEGGSSLLISPHVHEDGEEVRVYGRAGRPVLMGKGLGAPQTDGLDLLGEATGIVRFATQDHAAARKRLDALIAADIANEHEELTRSLMRDGTLEARIFPKGLLFMETDFAEDFERAREEVYPRILERDDS